MSAIDMCQVDDEVNNGGGESFRISRPRQYTRRRARCYYRFRGDNGPTWDIPNNDIESVSHAILERVFFVKSKTGKGFCRAPKPWEHESMKNCTKPFYESRRKVARRLEKFNRKMEKAAKQHGKVSPIESKEFLAYYGGAKLKCYTAAVDSLEDTPLSRKDCRVKVFTKDEYRKPGGAPRAIQPRSPRFNVMLGRYIKHLEHEIFHAIDLIFDPSEQHKTVAKGMNMTQRGETIRSMWESFDNPVAVGLDASRFDQHINRLLLEHEHNIYHMWSSGKGEGMPYLSSLLREQLKNRGVYIGPDGRITYEVDGCRMSGDMNTSLGNVIIMCSLMYAFFDEKGLTNKIRLLNDGDDCVIIMDKKSLQHFTEGMQSWFLEMGLTMEYDGIYNTLEQVEFCQSRPVKMANGEYRLVPRPTKRLYSDLISTKNLSSKKVYRKMLGAIAGCGLAASSGVPVFQSFYQWLGRGATPWIPSQGDYYAKFRQELVGGMEMKTRAPTLEERISFYFSFDITPDEQMMLENYYSALPDPIWTEPQTDPTRRLDSIQYMAPPEQKER